MQGIPGFIWRALSRVLDEGQSWVVITIVGMYMYANPPDTPLTVPILA